MSLTRDQCRASHGYQCVQQVAAGERKEYDVAVNSFGANVMRTGLVGAITFLQRKGRKANETFLKHLAAAAIPGLEGATADDLGGKIRNLDRKDYMLATRESLKVALWFRRAVQATGKEED